MASAFFALDLGGTKCAALLGRLGEAHDVLDKRIFSTASLGAPQDALATLGNALDEMAEQHGVKPEAIGISCGNPMNAREGIVLSPPNMQGWANVSVVETLVQRFGVPARLMNDANAGCLAEARFGAAKGYRHAVFLTMGTGMGAGLILNGSLYEGASGSGGEVGHMRLFPEGPVGYGKRGSFEGFCSGGGIAQMARQRAVEAMQRGKPLAWCAKPEHLAALMTKQVAEAAHAGDDTARAVFAEAGTWLGRGLALILDIINPEVVAIGGVYPRCRELLEKSMRTVLSAEVLPDVYAACAIVPAQLGEAIGDVSALCVAETAKRESA